MATIRVKISRTIQEKQYHPFNVELEASEDSITKISAEDLRRHARNLADLLISEVDSIMSDRIRKLKAGS